MTPNSPPTKLRINPPSNDIGSKLSVIQEDNISIGIQGIMVDGKKVTSVCKSLNELKGDEILGSGVSGTVKLVRHVETNVPYALKIMQFENSDEFLRKKLVELKTLHASQHQNIVNFYGAFYVDGVLSFILEYMDRGTFFDLLKVKKIIPEIYLSRLSLDILSGLEYLHHTLHLIHRDIKPQNILINSQGVVKLADFGVSGEISNSQAFKNTFIGTIKYMSPNRIKGTKHSLKSDIWSFGLVVLESAKGEYPYGNNLPNFFNFLQKVVNIPPPIPERGIFTPEFDSFISMCLQKEEEKLPLTSELLKHPWIEMYRDTVIIDWLLEDDSNESHSYESES